MNTNRRNFLLAPLGLGLIVSPAVVAMASCLTNPYGSAAFRALIGEDLVAQCEQGRFNLTVTGVQALGNSDRCDQFQVDFAGHPPATGLYHLSHPASGHQVSIYLDVGEQVTATFNQLLLA